ncbi:helix-turn-helix domain-containing protein [Phyllobacterium sp. SB3]|uniref:helix-turn-helix domain-containing protein n=1 Tax=Phyllobacterium sp. SB3 TaxID=3156073 RepID=UPI0032AF7462
MAANFNRTIRSAADARAMIYALRSRRDKAKPVLVVAQACEAIDERPFRTCDHVLDILSAFFNISGRDLRSHSRCERAVARVRQIGMYVVHVTLGMSMTEVGRAFGRDRSTVAHACHLIEDMREDQDFDRIVQTVETVVRAAFANSGRVRR